MQRPRSLLCETALRAAWSTLKGTSTLTPNILLLVAPSVKAHTMAADFVICLPPNVRPTIMGTKDTPPG